MTVSSVFVATSAATVDDGSVTLAKHASLATGKALGRVSSGSGAVEAVDLRAGVLLGSGSLNMNTTADQGFALAAWITKYVVRRIVVYDASVDLSGGSTAGGVYTAASKGGTAIVANTQVYTALSAATKALDLTIAAAGLGVYFTAATLYFALTTGFGSAATAKIAIFGDVLN